jgi:hypothetical protein
VALSSVGITLKQDTKDLLIWTNGNLSERMTIKNFYNAILTTLGLLSWSGWKVQFWKW